MSRPASYHTGSGHSTDLSDPNGFSLPLFNPNPPQQYRPPQVESHPAQFLPPPHNTGHVHRASFAGSSGYTQQGANSPSRPTLTPPTNNQGHRSHVSMASTLPYATVPYPQSAHPTSSSSQMRHDELMPPPSSSSFGSLARSASLGTRKKDPYAYPSDDVERGLGSMDMGAEPTSGGWEGYAGSSARGAPSQYYDRDVAMSSPNRGYPTSASSTSSMPPPPIPSHTLASSNASRESGTSPSRSYSHTQASNSMSNPYIPRNPETGNVSAQQPQRADYRTQRMTSSSSYHSHSSENQLSPYLPTRSPLSPLHNPYDSSPTLPPTQPLTPSQSAGGMHWGPPASPQRAMSYQHQLYPASQPVTPATKNYDMGPPKGLPTRDRSRAENSTKAGFREVRDVKDLKPVVNSHPNGRRADPTVAGKYLSVSGPT
jgi:hypothetical protein